MKTIFQFVCLMFLTVISSFAQDEAKAVFPEVGKPCPPFELTNLQGYATKKRSSKDLKGRHVILDFFTAGCSACFESFPKLDRAFRNHRPSLEIFLIGNNQHLLPEIFARYKQKLRLNFPVCFDDSKFDRFGVDGVPYLIWIDEKGVVRGLTSSLDLTDENIDSFLSNKALRVRNISPGFRNLRRAEFDSVFMMSLGKYKAGKIFSGSSLISWTSDMPMTHVLPEFQPLGDHAYFQILGASIGQLITLAFTGNAIIGPQDSLYGRVCPNPVFEMDSAEIPAPDYTSGEGMYCYSMVTSAEDANKPALQRKLLEDIEHALGYEIRKEMRMMPCWYLYASPGAAQRLNSKSDKTKITRTPDGLDLKHVRSNFLVGALWSTRQDGKPVIDLTGMDGFLDLRLDALITDFEEMRKAYEKNGLFLRPGSKLMEVMVIRRKKDLH